MQGLLHQGCEFLVFSAFKGQLNLLSYLFKSGLRLIKAFTKLGGKCSVGS